MFQLTVLCLLVALTMSNAMVPLAARSVLDIERLEEEQQDDTDIEERGAPRLQCLSCDGSGACTFRRLRCARGEVCIAFNDGKEYYYGCAAPVICQQMSKVLERTKCCSTDNCNWDL